MWFENVSISNWNINGLIERPAKNIRVCKMSYANFRKKISDHDIVLLSETRVGNQDDIDELELENYRCYPKCRQQSANGVYYGGVCLYIKNSILKGTTIVKDEPNTEHFWVKLDQGFFKLKCDIFVCLTYIRPGDSAGKVSNDSFDLIESEVAYFRQFGKCLTTGDLNGHTNTENDYIEVDSVGRVDTQYAGIPNDYVPDRRPLTRSNCDKSPLNDQGKSIIDLCISSGLRILNGRTLGDIFGSPTFYGPQCISPTTLDYALCDDSLLPEIISFEVSEFTPFSDHCQIVTKLRTGKYEVPKQNTKVKLEPIPDKFIWDPVKKQHFLNNLKHETCQNELNAFINTNFEHTTESLNLASESLINTINKAASPVFSRRTFKKCNKKRKPKYFDIDIRKANKELHKLSREVSNNHQNRQLRQNFYKKRKEFKKAVKSKIKLYKDSLVNKLNDTSLSDPSEYWNIIQELSKLHSEKSNNSEHIKPEVWIDHFKGLMTGDMPDSPVANEVKSFLENKENWHIFNELSYKITSSEISKAIKKLKNNKACGDDMILNEMLKTGEPILNPTLVKLFNLVLISGNIPDCWCVSYLIPLHKGGSKSDPNCFRGISIMSCLGKLFFSILNIRLINYLKTNNLNNDFQIGFAAGSRPADHMLTIKTISDKYLGSGKKVYSCFVDFKKAFDTVWRDGLLYKLLKKGIGGPFGKIIQKMYDKSFVSIKLPSGLTESFKADIGVKQGCVLSPTLFNIFINDIPETFDSTCDPVLLHDLNISCLLFADDIVLLSETKEGLQNCLERLQDYCDKWLLRVNTKKTKIMIMNKQGKLLDDMKFTLNGDTLETVKYYKYLGLMLNNSGSFTSTIDNLSNRAMKAIFKVKKVINGTNIAVKSAVHLFDTLVKPIMTYGCEVWGPYITSDKMFEINAKNYESFHTFKFEKTNLRFCKSILGVHRKASNAAVLGDLGRYPLIIFIIKQAIKFWSRVAAGNSNKVLQACYLENVNLVNKGKQCWLGHLKNIVLNKLGLNEIWYNLGTKLSPKQVSHMTSCLKSIYKAQWEIYVFRNENGTNGGNKLRSYNQFKTHYCTENYLSLMTNSYARKFFSRLRTSAHNLRIETGRHTFPRTPLEARLCRHCNILEDEMHFTLFCCKNPAMTDARISFLTDFIRINPEFEDLNDRDKFIYIMSVNTEENCILVQNFVKELVLARGSL